MNIKIIGLGGIGSILSDKLLRFLKFSLKRESAVVTLIDGDEYEMKNMERQDFHNFGNKAQSKAEQLMSQFDGLVVNIVPEFVDESNLKDLIKDGDVILLAVDNHKTRKIVNDHVKTLKNAILISGGNELTDGNVQRYVREKGKDITPSLTDYHPEIENPADKLPTEMSCQELEESEPQLYFTNLTVATIMCQMFRKTLEKDYEISEVYFDIDKITSRAVSRPVLS